MNKKKWFIFLPVIAFLFIVLLYFLYPQDDIIKEEKFIPFYCDMIIAQDSTGSDINSMKLIREKLFKKYNTDEATYKRTLRFYREDPKRMGEFFDKVIKHIEELKTKSARI